MSIQQFVAEPSRPIRATQAILASIHAPSACTEPLLLLELGRYQLRLARTPAERANACRLRFRVFNLELGEGLLDSYATGLDQDAFDRVCEHLIVEDQESGAIVGTYRLQTGASAGEYLGYYSAVEFDFSPFNSVRHQVLELGRASIDKDHRGSEVLTLLWRGIARYAQSRGLRYLIGCSSLNSTEAAAGWHTYRQLGGYLTEPAFRTRPQPGYALTAAQPTGDPLPKIPKLLRTYLGVGARICGAPAWDREFGTIDFLTLLDLHQLTPAARVRFQISPC